MFLSSMGELTSLGLRVVEFLDRERFAGQAPLDDEQVFGRTAGARRPESCRRRQAGRRRRAPGRAAEFPAAVPSRTTVAVTWIMALSFAAAASARASCKKRSPTLSTTIIAITVPARASPVANEIADRAASRITSGLRMIFRRRMGQPCRLLLRHFIRTRGARPIFGFVLRQAALRGAQVPQQLVTVLAGGVEDSGRNMNLVVLGLSWNRRLVRFKHHRSSRGATNALQFDDRRFT